MALYLKIDQDKNCNFFTLYDMLGELQQQIWKRIVWYVRRYPSAHPTQTKIAKGIPCSRKHVNRTLKLFKDHGWIRLMSRGKCRAKCISILNGLSSLDVSKREWVRKVEVTSKVTHSTSNNKNTSRETGTVKIFHKKSKERVLDPPSWTRSRPFSADNQLKLALCSQDAYRQAYSETSDRLRAGWKIHNFEDYLTECTLQIAKKRGEKLDWRAYYYTKEKAASSPV